KGLKPRLNPYSVDLCARWRDCVRMVVLSMHGILLGVTLTGMLALPAATQGESLKTEIDNGLVRVLRRQLQAGETIVVAETPQALFVFLTNYSVRVTTATRKEELRGQLGGFLWHSGGEISWRTWARKHCKWLRWCRSSNRSRPIISHARIYHRE